MEKALKAIARTLAAMADLADRAGDAWPGAKERALDALADVVARLWILGDDLAALAILAGGKLRSIWGTFRRIQRKVADRVAPVAQAGIRRAEVALRRTRTAIQAFLPVFASICTHMGRGYLKSARNASQGLRGLWAFRESIMEEAKA